MPRLQQLRLCAMQDRGVRCWRLSRGKSRVERRGEWSPAGTPQLCGGRAPLGTGASGSPCSDTRFHGWFPRNTTARLAAEIWASKDLIADHVDLEPFAKHCGSYAIRQFALAGISPDDVLAHSLTVSINARLPPVSNMKAHNTPGWFML